MAEGFSRRVFLATMGGLAVLWALPARGWSLFLSQFETRTVEKENFTFDPSVGDTESGPKRDILERASTGIRADHCLNFPA